MRSRITIRCEKKLFGDDELFHALEGGVELVADGLGGGAEAGGDFGDGEVLYAVHVENFFHTVGEAVDGLEDVLFGFFEVDFFLGGGVGGLDLGEGVDVFLVEGFVAHGVEEAVFEGGAEVGVDGGDRGEGGVDFPEVDE